MIGGIAIMKKLHKLIDGKKAKNVATTIHALNNLSFLDGYESKAELYRAMCREFEITFSNTGLNNFLNENQTSILEADIIKRRKNILSAIK